MATGKKTKVMSDAATTNQTAVNSTVVNVLGFAKVLAWIKNVGASYDLQWKIQGRATGDDSDAAWDTIMDWTTVGEGVSDFAPQDEDEEAKLNAAWDEMRIQIRRLSGQGGETTANAWINRKRR